MESDGEHRTARQYVSSLLEQGRYAFFSDDARRWLGVSAVATKLALRRLIERGELASPARGFYVVVAPEYRRLGCLPADQFVPELLERRGLRYYAGLLSAAQYHGAAHHRPQAFQVLLAKNRRPIQCGAVRVEFVARRRIAEVETQSVNTPRGVLRVSTPAATAIDLAGYPHHAGGLDNVATVLSDLAELLDADALVAAAQTAPLSWAQRLGYLLTYSGARDRTEKLRSYVQRTARDIIPLVPGASSASVLRDHDWKLDINAHVEPEG